MDGLFAASSLVVPAAILTSTTFAGAVSAMGEAVISMHRPADGVLILSVCLAIFFWFYFRSLAGSNRLPPGPLALPVIGHLHHLSWLPHRSFATLSHKYGPIFFMRMGSLATVVVSSAELAKEFLHHHDVSFSHRPPMEIGDRLMYGRRSTFVMDYNTRWRDLRKLYSQTLLSPQSIQQYRQARDEEVLILLQNIEEKSGTVVPLRRVTFELSTNVLSRVLFSKRSEGRFAVLLDLIAEGSKVFTAPIIGDLIPYLKWFDPAGYRKKMDSMFQRWDALLQGVVSERLSTPDKPKDILTQLLEFNKPTGDTMSVKASLLEILGAGSETTSSTIEWAIAELLRNPETMRKLQEELREVVGAHRQVNEADFPNLRYLHAVMNETWRLHPPLPLLLPHYAKEETEIGGYKLPKNTTLMINAWAIGRDSKVWQEPEEFRPERFMPGGEAEGKDAKGRNYELLPFGTGRRGCPGIHLGMAVSTLALANLVHSFDWKLAPEFPSTAMAKTMETPGVTAAIDPALLAIPTPRRTLT